MVRCGVDPAIDHVPVPPNRAEFLMLDLVPRSAHSFDLVELNIPIVEVDEEIDTSEVCFEPLSSKMFCIILDLLEHLLHEEFRSRIILLTDHAIQIPASAI